MRLVACTLAFLIPLQGALACPNLEALEPFLKYIEDRLIKQPHTPLIIEGTTYKVLPGEDGDTAGDILSGAYEGYTIERLDGESSTTCEYRVKDDNAFVSGNFTLQREY